MQVRLFNPVSCPWPYSMRAFHYDFHKRLDAITKTFCHFQLNPIEEKSMIFSTRHKVILAHSTFQRRHRWLRMETWQLRSPLPKIEELFARWRRLKTKNILVPLKRMVSTKVPTTATKLYCSAEIFMNAAQKVWTSKWNSPLAGRTGKEAYLMSQEPSRTMTSLMT